LIVAITAILAMINIPEYTVYCTDPFQNGGKQHGGLYGRSKITKSFQKTMTGMNT